MSIRGRSGVHLRPIRGRPGVEILDIQTLRWALPRLGLRGPAPESRALVPAHGHPVAHARGRARAPEREDPPQQRRLRAGGPPRRDGDGDVAAPEAPTPEPRHGLGGRSGRQGASVEVHGGRLLRARRARGHGPRASAMPQTCQGWTHTPPRAPPAMRRPRRPPRQRPQAWGRFRLQPHHCGTPPGDKGWAGAGWAEGAP